MLIRFTVERPISINRMYGRGNGRRLYTKPEGVEFKERIKSAALIARQSVPWPSNLYSIRRAELSYQLYDCKLDSDAPRKCLKDSLEQILYVNDRLVQDGTAPLPILDGKGSRVVVMVEILELCDAAMAKKLKEKAEKLEISRLTRRAKPKRKKAA